jgi:phage shock protein A
MNNLILWLMGDTLGEHIVNGWNWLWQIPVEPSPTTSKTNDDITLEHATQLLRSIGARVTQMERVVHRVRSIAQEIQRQYDLKCREHQELIGIVLQYQNVGDNVEARLTMAKAIGIERILPELKVRLERAQEMLININECHTQEQAKFSLLEIELETIKACMAMNESMGGSRDLDKFTDLSNLQDKFQQVQSEMEDRYQQIQVMSQLSHPSNCVLEETLNIQAIDDRIRAIGNWKV